MLLSWNKTGSVKGVEVKPSLFETFVTRLSSDDCVVNANSVLSCSQSFFLSKKERPWLKCLSQCCDFYVCVCVCGSVSSCLSAYNYIAVSEEEGNTLTPPVTSERLLDRLQGNFDNRYPCVLWRVDPDMFADPLTSPLVAQSFNLTSF